MSRFPRAQALLGKYIDFVKQYYVPVTVIPACVTVANAGYKQGKGNIEPDNTFAYIYSTTLISAGWPVILPTILPLHGIHYLSSAIGKNSQNHLPAYWSHKK